MHSNGISRAGNSVALDDRTPKLKPLRIAVVTQYFWPEDFRVNDLVGELASRGHDVQVLTGQPNYPDGEFTRGYGGLMPQREAACGGNVVRVPLVPRRQGTSKQLLFNYISFATSATCLGPSLVRGPVDAVLAYEPSPVTVAAPALALARLKKAPALMWVQDLWPDTLAAMGVLRSSLFQRTALAATGLVHRKMDSLLVQSKAFVGPLCQQGAQSNRVHYVPNWAEDLYRPVTVPAAAPQRQELPTGFKILFAGNVGVAQGLDVVLRAAELLRELKDLHWVILGSGRQAEWLGREVQQRRLEGTVHLLGRRPLVTMPTWFSLADVLLATLRPDRVYELTLPSKLQTYLACGKPVLASMDGEGARVLRESGGGLVTRTGDAGALAEGARHMYDAGPDALASMGKRGLAYYREHFDRVAIIDRVEELLQTCATKWSKDGRP